MFIEIHKLLLGRGGYGQRIQTLENKMTDLEQRLMNAAQVVDETVAALKEYQEAMKAKFEQLSQQAQAPVAATEVVDLSEEFSAFDKAMEGLSQFSASLKGETTGVIPGEETTQSPVVNNSTAQNPDFTPQVPTSEPEMHEPTPLAGNSGVTNPPDGIAVPDGQVFAGQQQPGMGVPVSHSEEGEAEEDSSLEDDDDLADEEVENFGQQASADTFAQNSTDNVPQTQEQNATDDESGG